jgi:hypothetical protein
MESDLAEWPIFTDVKSTLNFKKTEKTFPQDEMWVKELKYAGPDSEA